MSKNLTTTEFKRLIEKVFSPRSTDRVLLILVDSPGAALEDNPIWQDRRSLASEWQRMLHKVRADLGLESIDLLYYETPGSNNANLPADAFRYAGDPKVVDSTKLRSKGESVQLEEALSSADIILAPTELSGTVPPK